MAGDEKLSWWNSFRKEARKLTPLPLFLSKTKECSLAHEELEKEEEMECATYFVCLMTPEDDSTLLPSS
jgi:hypothetical protein